MHRHSLPPLQAHILLPPLEAMKQSLDRMKAISNHIKFMANMQGELKMVAQSDLVEVETEYSDLKHPRLSMIAYWLQKYPHRM